MLFPSHLPDFEMVSREWITFGLTFRVPPVAFNLIRKSLEVNLRLCEHIRSKSGNPARLFYDKSSSLNSDCWAVNEEYELY